MSLELAPVGVAHRPSVDRRRYVSFKIAEQRPLVERKVDLGRIDRLPHDQVVPPMRQPREAQQDFVGISIQIADDDRHAASRPPIGQAT
ncbi:MAG: hypothetical protein QM811_26685 [Pirellulales bacterium]